MKKYISAISLVFLLLESACMSSINELNTKTHLPEAEATFLATTDAQSFPETKVSSLSKTKTPSLLETTRPPDDEQIGTVTRVEEMVRHGFQGSVLKELLGTDPLFDGDSVSITEGGECRLDFGDSMLIRLFNDTELNDVRRTSADGTPLGVQIYLALGGFTGKITEEGSQAIVRTPGGTSIKVFGTEFFVIYNPDLELTAVGNFDGSLEVESGNIILPVSPGHFRNVPDGDEPREEKQMPISRVEFENRARDYLSPIDAAASFEGGIVVEASEPPATDEPPAIFDYLSRAYAGEFKGTTVTIMGPDPDAERMYSGSFADFEERTGIDIQYTGNSDFETILMAKLASGEIPDIVDINQPVLLAKLIDEGWVLDISKFMNLDALRANYNPCWLDMATKETSNGEIMAGVWHRYNTKGLVWYPKDNFEEAGYSIPLSWEDMLTLSDQIVGDGSTPWCIGIESGSYTGWTATDWVEEIMLRTTSLENYDRWVRGDLPFNSSEVRQAFEIMSGIWFNDEYINGGSGSIANTNYREAPLPMFDDPPGCWLHKQAYYINEYFPDGVQYGVDFDVFYLPTINEQYGTIINVYGNIMVMLNDRPEVRAVMEFLATGASTRAWLDIGSQLSPHNDTILDWYGKELDRKIAEFAREADCFRYDGSYTMPYEVGMESFFNYITAYVKGEISLDTALDEIDNSWP